ncbi:MAG: 16S rRNA (uracil(1498)-N(3))-methyltransferase [Pirellulales bacterium]|nr:16S rRNA (uracil(1498)-N(3))-methyltransferase [Pirellulales bacterium]
MAMADRAEESTPTPTGPTGQAPRAGRGGDRFFVAEPIEGDRAVLAEAEAHHLAHVLRAVAGDNVTLFDGSGVEYAARVVKVSRHRVELEVVGRRAVDRELPVELTLAVALPKGERQKWLVEKAVELGAARFVPIETVRGVAQPGLPALERLGRQAIEASKQCGRNRLMEVCPARSWAELAKACPSATLRLAAHPGGGRAPIDVVPDPLAAPTIVAVGPEGGFTEEEIALAAGAGWTVVDLGPRILRVETAALALAALVAARARG